jgi:hypothetical protein
MAHPKMRSFIAEGNFSYRGIRIVRFAKQTLMGSPTNASVFCGPFRRYACDLWVETGRVGFLAVLCEERRLRDPKAAYLSKGRVNPAPDPGCVKTPSQIHSPRDLQRGLGEALH